MIVLGGSAVAGQEGRAIHSPWAVCRSGKDTDLGVRHHRF